MRYLVNEFFRVKITQGAGFPAARERLFRRDLAPFLLRAPCVRALILTNKYGIFEKFSHNLKFKKKCQICNRL